MKIDQQLFCPVFLWLLIGVPGVQALEQEQQPPLKYRMELIYVFEAGKTEYIFTIGNSGFKSVASLKQFIGQLPVGSIIEWAPGCERFGTEPLLSSEEEMESFKAFCKEKGMRFILVPSG